MPNLYVTEPGARLEREAGQIVVASGDEVLLAVPAVRIETVVAVGNVGITTPALHLLLERSIGLVFLTSGGRFRGRLSPATATNVKVRRRQYARADDSAFCLALGRAIVSAKIRNCRTLCLRLDATNQDPVFGRASGALHDLLARLDTAAAIDALMGIEGLAARHYFAALRHHLRPPWTFVRRARRPPPDPVNALFSLVYTLLHESCHAALEAVGLDPYCGYLHRPHPGRASLALDLMEEFRPIIADSVVLTLLNKRMVTPTDFAPCAEGGVMLSREGWHIVAAEYARRLRTLVRPPGLGRRISYQKVLEVQARHLRRMVEGDVREYVPFLAK